MDASSTSHCQGSFPFMSLPRELRLKVYSFAVIQRRPITLWINYYGLATTETLGPGRVKLFTVMEHRMLETCHEFRQELTKILYAENTFDISLWWREVGEGTSVFQIDLKRIKICRLSIHDLSSTMWIPHRDVSGMASPLYWHHHLRALVATLVFQEHHIESMLVECVRQDPVWLLECLRPMAMLRGFGLVLFRFSDSKVHPYFRFLEACMMSNRHVPFGDRQEFRQQTEPWRPRFLSVEAARGPPPRSTDMTGERVVISEEERKDLEKAFYEMLRIEDELRPQEDL